MLQFGRGFVVENCGPSRLVMKARAKHRVGFTPIEMLLVVAIVAMLMSMLVPVVTQAKRKATVTVAITDIRSLMQLITIYEDDHRGAAPLDLASVIDHEVLDPWDGEYVYNRFDTISKDELRYYKAGNPLNSRYDLYSRGPDQATSPSLHSGSGRDDIVRAADGLVVARASEVKETITAAGL